MEYRRQFQIVFYDHPLKGVDPHFEIFINSQSSCIGVPGTNSFEMDNIVHEILLAGGVESDEL